MKRRNPAHHGNLVITMTSDGIEVRYEPLVESHPGELVGLVDTPSKESFSGPSASRMAATLRNRPVPPARITVDEAKILKALMNGTVDPVKVAEFMGLTKHFHNDPLPSEAIMLIADAFMLGNGVEGAEGAWLDRYHQNIQISYVNMGDTYDTTLIFDHKTQRFLIRSWGDFVETHPSRFPSNNPGGGDEDEDEDDDDFDLKTEMETGYVIGDAGRGGYAVSREGKYVDTFREKKDALMFVAQDMYDSKYWPNVFFVNDHGNVDLVILKVKEIKGKVIKVNYKLGRGWV